MGAIHPDVQIWNDVVGLYSRAAAIKKVPIIRNFCYQD
jgi:hypothetical protein